MLMLASAGLNLYSSFQGSQESKKSAQANAAIYEQQAYNIDVAKYLTLSKIEREKQATAGTIRAQAGLYGGTMSGSPIEILNRNFTEYELDKALTKHNYETEKAYALASRDMVLSEGKAKSNAFLLEGIGGALSSGSQLSTKFGKTSVPKSTK